MRAHPRLSLLALLLLLAACHAKSTDESGGAHVVGDTVTLTSAGTGGISVVPLAAAAARAIELPGRIVWDEDHTVRIFSPFSGRVVKVVAQPGEHVAAGQILALVSSADFGSAQADNRKAQAILAQAGKSRDRQRDLLAHGVVAAREAEQAEADYASADAEAQRAQARLKLFGDAGDTVDQLYRLATPIAGIVVEKHINPGQELLTDQSGVPLFVVTDPSTLWVQIDAHENDLPTLNAGQAFTFSAAGYGDHIFSGKLLQIADYVDTTSRTIPLRGSVSNADRRLKGEMYVSVSLPQPSRAEVAVPATAVFLMGDRQYVFICKSPGVYQRRGITTEPGFHNMVPVIAGVKPGEMVVGSGALYLQQLMLAHTGDR